jgi:hypothetical protein
MEPVCSEMGKFDTDQFRDFRVNDGSIKRSMAEVGGD